MEANIHNIRLSGYGANTKCLHFGTAGSYGIEALRIEKADVWQGAAITAAFLRENKSVRVHLGEENLIPVPQEATAKQTTEHDQGMIVFEGLGSDGRVYTTGIPFTVSGHPGTEGDNTEEITPTEQQQLWTAVQRLVDEIPAIKQDAADAAQSASDAASAAESAAQSAAAVNALFPDGGLSGQVLTSNGNGTCRWASPAGMIPAAPEYDGGITVAGDPVSPVPEYDGGITVAGDPVPAMPEYDGSITVV